MTKRILMTASSARHIRDFHLPYMKAFQEMGYQVEVACAGTEGVVLPADRVISLPFEKSLFSLWNWKIVGKLKKEIEKQRYDLVLCHTSLAAFFTRLSVRLARTGFPVVCTVHGYLFDERTFWPKKALLAGAELWLAPVTDLLLTMNCWDTMFAKKHRLGKRICQIPGMGVNFRCIEVSESRQGEILRKKLKISSGDFVLVYAAEFSKRKNQGFLLNAMTGLPERVKLILPGDGTLRKDCMAKAKELGIADRVFFPGYVDNMPLWYQAADAVVSSSRSEGLPFHIMEAMGRGLPVIVSKVKGHTDLVKEGKTGLLYPAGDLGVFQAQVLRLEKDDLYRKELGQNAKAAVQEYELSRVLPQVMALYMQLL